MPLQSNPFGIIVSIVGKTGPRLMSATDVCTIIYNGNKSAVGLSLPNLIMSSKLVVASGEGSRQVVENILVLIKPSFFY